MSVVLETESLVPHLHRIETEGQFPHAVLGPRLQARAMSEAGDAYVLAPALPSLEEDVFEEEIGFSRLADLVAACELVKEGRYSKVTFSMEGPDLVIRGQQEHSEVTAIQTARPSEVGTYVSPEEGDELRSRLEDGQASQVQSPELKAVVDGDAKFGAGLTTLEVEGDGARVKIGQPGAMHTVPLPSVKWKGEPFQLEVTGQALARAAKTVPENVKVELILEGPHGHLALRTADGFVHALPHLGD